MWGAWPPPASLRFPISLFKVYRARGSRGTRCPGPAQIVSEQSRNYSCIQKKSLNSPAFHPEARDFPSDPAGTVGNAPLGQHSSGGPRVLPLAGICCTQGWQIPVLTFTDGDCFPQICWFTLTGFHLLILPPKPSGPVSRYLQQQALKAQAACLPVNLIVPFPNYLEPSRAPCYYWSVFH